MGFIDPEMLLQQPDPMGAMQQMMMPQEPEFVVEPDGADEPPEESQSPEERLAELLELFNVADDNREQYKEKALEWYRLFVGYRKPLTAVQQGRSNIHVPLTYEHNDTLRARMFKAFFGTRPFIEFKPKPQNSDDLETYNANVEKAKLAAALVDEQLEKNQIQRKWYSFITSMLIYPASVLGVGWRYETRKVKRRKFVEDGAVNPLVPLALTPQTKRVEYVEEEAVVWDDNEIVNIDFWDFWVDPMGWDIDSCRYVWHRVWMTKPQIQRELHMLEEAGRGTVNEVDWEELEESDGELFEGKAERLTSIGISQPTTDPNFGEQRDRLGLYEVLHYWEDDRHSIVINRSVLAFDGPNPYWRHGKKPFCVGVFDPLPNEFYGLTSVQLNEHLQAELNTIRNQRIDNTSFSLNKMWRIEPSSDIDESELVSRPGGMVHARQGDLEQLHFGEVNTSGYQEEVIVRQDMENVLGVPAIVRGVTPARKETATEVITKNNNASIRFDAKIMLAEAVFKRLAYLMDCNNQQFITTDRVARQFGPNGVEQWAEITPDSVIGEWDYIPAGSSIDPAANRDIRREQLGQMVMYATQTQQANPYLKLYELTKLWVESFDARGLQTAVRTPDEVKQEQQEAMQQQMMMQQMMAQQQMQQQMQAQAMAQQQVQEQAMMQQAQGQGGLPAQLPDQDSIPPQALAMLALNEGVPG